MRLAVAILFGTAACGGASSSATTGSAPQPGPVEAVPRSATLNHDGEWVDIDAAVPAGYVTIVDFSADYCGACKVLDARMQADLAVLPAGTAIVRRDVAAGEEVDSPIMTGYKIRALPQVRVYDATRTLRYVLVGNATMDVVQKALELLHEPAKRP